MPVRPRVAVITPLFPTNAEPYRGIYVYNTLRELSRLVDLRVFCPTPVFPRWRILHPKTLRYNVIDTTYSVPDVSASYVPYSAFPLVSRPVNGANCARALLPQIGSFGPDLILSYWLYPDGYAATEIASELRVPSIVTALGSDLRRISDSATRRLTAATLRRAEHVLAVSSELRQRAIELGASTKRTTVVLNGCDLSVFYPRDRLAARARLGLPPDVRLILFVGWLAKLKGVGDLADVFETLDARDKVMLACIGEGHMSEELRTRAAKPSLDGRMLVVGAKTSGEVSSWLAASDLLALPSYSEGCPNVVVEALSSGRPVVASAVGGIPELVGDDCAILIPPGDKEALTKALKSALTRDWSPHIISARMRRSWKAVAEETFAVCDRVLDERSGRRFPSIRRHRISVVTPLFPTEAEPYRGQAIYRTVLELQRLCDVEVFCPQPEFPRWSALHPKTLRYSAPKADYVPEGIERLRHFAYSALPVISRPFNGLNCAHKLLPLLRESRPDMILAYWIYPDAFAAVLVAKRLGVPVAVGARGSDLRRIGDGLTRWFVKRTLLGADVVLTVSAELGQHAVRLGSPPSHVNAILNGCDTSVYKLRDKQNARRELRVSPQAELILFVGWLAPLKGLNELIPAVRDLASRRPHLQLALIGEGSLSGKLKAQALEADLAGRLRCLGQQPPTNVAQWLAAADILVLPSHSEGCPNVVLEALSSGCPVVATDVGGLPELINAINGILVPPGDSSRLADALDRALRHNWNRNLIATSFQRTWTDVAADTFEVCESCLSHAMGQAGKNA